MKLTTFTDYCLRVLIYLAAEPGQRATIAGIATAYDISEHHLVKVVHFLGKQGLLTNVRGKGGGLELAHAAHEVGVGQVVRQAEGHVAVVECFDPFASHCCIAPACRLHGALDEAVAAFYAVLDRYTLADLVANREQLAPLLFVDPQTALPARRARSAA